tara:strand:- start:1225 stop:1575 length:351 start_codon:yes stop_codon:yes gene_type:complete
MEKQNENQDHVTIEETAAECIERLKSELAEAKETSEIRRLELTRLSEQIDDIEEEALIAFGRIPYLMQWVENIVKDKIDLAIDEAKEESQGIAKDQIREMIEEILNDATFDTSIIL